MKTFSKYWPCSSMGCITYKWGEKPVTASAAWKPEMFNYMCSYSTAEQRRLAPRFCCMQDSSLDSTLVPAIVVVQELQPSPSSPCPSIGSGAEMQTTLLSGSCRLSANSANKWQNLCARGLVTTLEIYGILLSRCAVATALQLERSWH